MTYEMKATKATKSIEQIIVISFPIIDAQR